MQGKAAEHFYPQWRIWASSNERKQFAMDLDARRTSHPLRHAVANESEAMAMFDAITYSKGAAIIRMLEDHLGPDVFREGLRRYMAEHAYGNATTADLWHALEAASGRPVAAIAGTFIEQAGVPLIVAQASCVGGLQHMVLRQERFTVNDPGAAPQRWQVPVTIGPLRALRSTERVLLQDEPKEIVTGPCGETVKLNLGDIGYYRVLYDAATRAGLAKSFAMMSLADRANLLNDGWALVDAGRAEPASYLDLVEEIGSDDSRTVWDQVIRTLTRLDRLQRGRPARAAFQAYARGKLRALFDRVGWDAGRRENADREPLRARLIGVLGSFGDENVQAEAKRRFADFLKDATSLRPALREPVIRLAGITADRATYDTLLALARSSANTAERVRYYLAAAGARDPALAEDTLKLALGEELPVSLVSSVISEVASTGEHAELALDFVLKNFETLAARLGPFFRSNFVSNLMRNFSDRARAVELAAFAPVHETSGGRVVAARAEEAIRFDAYFKERVLPMIDDWIRRRSAPG
jgi:aminopeptidase N